MKDYYYLHIWALSGVDNFTLSSVLTTVEGSFEPSITFDAWPEDDLFSLGTMFFVTERLRSKLDNKKLSGIEFQKISNLTQGSNFQDQYPNAELPPFVWLVKVVGKENLNDFFLWDQKYLVVSAEALKVLRQNHVMNAEADQIKNGSDDYFSSEKKYFWMSDSFRNYFVMMEKKKQS